MLLDNFVEKYGRTGTVISAVPLVWGIAELAGLKHPEVPGANGDLDTNYEGKVEAGPFGCIDHIKCILFVQCHGFFAENVATGFQCFHCEGFVEFIGRGNGDHIQFFVTEHIGQSGITLINAVCIAHIFEPGGIKIRDRHNFRIGMGAVSFNMTPFSHPETDNTAT